jgi:murein L,D-transpeptidase YafK
MTRIFFTATTRWVPALLLVPLVLLVGACTVQNSGSLPDNRQGKANSEGAGGSAGGPASTANAVIKTCKADFLKRVHTIRNPSVSIQKGKRRLYLFQQDTLVREYPIGLGFNPMGDKEKDGDGRTPEGDFFICGKKDSDGEMRSLIISYPSRRHAETAHFQGVLSSTRLHGVLLSLEKGGQPPADTPLGGNVCIQGGGAHDDWTNGSVALYNADMVELYTIVSLGTPVHIRP